MYATLEEYKQMTNTPDGEDQRISLWLTISQAILDSILENQEQRQLTKTVSYEDLQRCQFRSSVFNIQSIDQINWEAYTGVVNEDFKINGWKNNAIFITDLWSYTLYNVPFMDITYTAWYSPVPWDLKEALIQLTQLQLSKQGWRAMKSYQLWPRTVVFEDNEETSSMIWSIESILTSYMLI